jgi:hypothetical protein
VVQVDESSPVGELKSTLERVEIELEAIDPNVILNDSPIWN